jgi:tripartite-type tricarboxylate transporter receptor subunit TctC
MKRICLALTALVVVAAMCSPVAAADDYPKKPITVIVPWGAGGISDVTGRMVIEYMKDILGQPLVVVNRGGAGGVVGLNAIAAAKPDGYTIGSGCMPLALTAPFFLDADQVDLNKLSYIGAYTPQERVLFTTPDKPFKTWSEFIAYAKAHPGELSVGSGGAQWALEVIKAFAKKEGLKLKYVLFKGGGDASAAILGGHVDLCETGTGTPAYQAAREGKLVMLANLGAEKVPYFPETKNMADLGYPYATILEYGMVAPAGTPEPIRAKLENALKLALEDKTLVENMTKMGLLPRFMSGKDFERVCREAVKSVPELAEYVKDIK